jgi:hypothetical protein
MDVSDLYKNFFSNGFEIQNLFLVFFFRFLYCIFIEVIFEGSCFELVS